MALQCATSTNIDKLLVKCRYGCHDGAMRSGYFRALVVCLLAALVVVLGGCFGGGDALGTPGASIPVGQSTQTIDVAGVSRTFQLYRPPGLRDGAPLVVMLHGGFGTGAQAERSYHWDTEADAGHFLVAYPDGLMRAWNAGSCCGEPQRTNTDDVGFITAMVGAIEQAMPIDRARVYATGMSNGAMMALRLGCQTDTFAAIAPVAGTLLTDCSGARSDIGAANTWHGRRQSPLQRWAGQGVLVRRDRARRRPIGAGRQRDMAWHRRLRTTQLDDRRGCHDSNVRVRRRAHRGTDLGGGRRPPVARW